MVSLAHVNAFPNTIPQTALLAGLLSGTWLPVYFAVAALGSAALNPILKRQFLQWSPRRADWKRPRNMPKTGCRAYAQCDLPAPKSRPAGMPSGHTQAVAFAAAFWTGWLWRQDVKPAHRLLATTVMWSLVAAIGYSRIVQKCHNLQQVLVGGLIGSVLGYGAFRFIS